MFSVVCMLCIVHGLITSAVFPDNNEGNNFTSNIVGGRDAKAGEYKFFAYIANARSPCSGSILNNDTVLTLAWCVYEMSNLVVYTGTIIRPEVLGQDDENVQKRRVDRVIINPDYVHSLDLADIPLPGDVAILKLKRPLKFNEYVGDPIKIPNGKLEKKAIRISKCMTIGFGINDDDTFTYPNTLQAVSVNVKSESFCTREFASVYNISWNRKLLCTYQRNGRNVCYGDQGSPLVCYANEQPILLGTAAFGPIPCSFGHAGWNRMKSYRSWIQQHA